MSTYDFFYLDSDGAVLERAVHPCKDDLDALDRGIAFSARSRVEVWHGARKVAELRQGHEPLAA